MTILFPAVALHCSLQLGYDWPGKYDRILLRRVTGINEQQFVRNFKRNGDAFIW